MSVSGGSATAGKRVPWPASIPRTTQPQPPGRTLAGTRMPRTPKSPDDVLEESQCYSSVLGSPALGSPAPVYSSLTRRAASRPAGETTLGTVTCTV
jgi:hypothetical protein